VTHDDQLIVADTPAQIAAACVRLLDQPERRRALGQAARAFVVSRYAWPGVADRLIAAYRKGLEAKASAAA
jgi:glycosyltransferase involved in cell wall biosynthesis